MRGVVCATFAGVLAACLPAGAQILSPPVLPAPTARSGAAPAPAGSILAPTPSVETAPALTPVKPPQTPTSLLPKRPFPLPAVAGDAPRGPARGPEPPPAAPFDAAAQAPYIPPPPPGFDPGVCKGGRRLSPMLAEACRNEFQRKVEADRARIAARREAERKAREEQEARKQGLLQTHLKPRAAPLEFFFSEQLRHGDVVMTDKGARVFIGASGAAPRREDFVAPGDPRAPRVR